MRNKNTKDRYLFKAKRVDDGEWVTGSLITCEDGTCKIATSCLEGKVDEPILVCAYDVDRDTIQAGTALWTYQTATTTGRHSTKSNGSRKRGLRVSEIRLNEDELEQIITAAAKRGVEIYKREEQKKHKADKYHDTFSLIWTTLYYYTKARST